jgi:ribosomal-protein-alanine N-acetyltransferase
MRVLGRFGRRRGDDSTTVVIGPLARRHVSELLTIEERIFPRPWTASLYYSEIAQPESRIYLVATVGGEIVGYIGCMLVVDEGHITTVGVSPEWHRRGIGTRLMHAIAVAAIARGAKSLTLEVRMTNSGAQDLYRAFGFVPAGIRKNYYPEVNEDGLVMWASDVDTPEYRERIDALLAKVELTGLERRDAAIDDG